MRTRCWRRKIRATPMIGCAIARCRYRYRLTLFFSSHPIKTIIDSASVSILWSKLSPEEQAEFLKIMDEPSSRHARQLLISQELESGRCEPWWEAAAADLSRSRRRFGPRRIRIPPAMLIPTPSGKPLDYYMCAIW